MSKNDNNSRLIKNNLPVIVSLDDLCDKLNIEKKVLVKYIYSNGRFYREVNIEKKSGGYRTLSVPSMNQKYIQRWILENILYTQECSENVTGFTPFKSILHNASPHINQEYIYKFDLKDFFSNIKSNKIFNLFYSLGFNTEVSDAFTRLCTYKNCLPQGAPTSPYLANLVCKKLDYRLAVLCQKYKFKYTRYADDITISGNYKILHFRKIFKKIIFDEGFLLNQKKIHLIRNGQQKKVTGIVVNEKLNISKKEIKKVRQSIFYIKKYGIESHLNYINWTSSCTKYKNHLYGKIQFINMVNSKIGEELLLSIGEIKF